MDLYEELSDMSHLLMQLEDNMTPSSYIPVAYNEELTALNSLRSSKRFVKNLRGKANSNPLFPVIPTRTSDLVNSNCVVYNVNIIEEKEKEKEEARRNILYNSYKIKKGKMKKKKYEDLTARERAHYVPEPVITKVVPRLDADGVPIFMKNSSHKQHLIDLQIELERKEAMEMERRKLLGDRQFNLYDKDGVKFMYDYNGKKLREDKYKPNQRRPTSAPAKVVNSAVFKGNILKKTTDHLEHNKTLDIVGSAKIHWEPGLLPFTTFRRKNAFNNSQSKAVLPMHYVRYWPEYQVLEDLDVVVTIEYCDGCENHEYFCRHNEGKYLAVTNAIAATITEKFSKYRCRYTCIVKPISESGNIVPSLSQKSNMDNSMHSNVKVSQLVLQQQLLSVDYTVRYGAMEIQIAILKDYVPIKHVLFSKLLHGKWPTKVLINKVLSKFIAEFQLDELKEPMKFNETMVTTAITVAPPSPKEGSAANTAIAASTTPAINWIFDGRYKPFIVKEDEAEAQPHFTYLTNEFMHSEDVKNAAVAHNNEVLEKAKEQERIDAERLEQERLERVRAEEEKHENERREREKLEIERLEKERLEKEKHEKERAEKERAEKERHEKERHEKERVEQEKAMQEILYKERLEKERAETESIEKVRAEQERLDKEIAEKERAEKERVEKEKSEKERVEKERAEKERVDKERAEQERAEQERLDKERAEKERAEKERAEQERAEKERAEKERAEQERAEQERAEKERAEKERTEQESEQITAKAAETKISPDAIINEIKNIVEFNDIYAEADSTDDILPDDDKNDDNFFNAAFGLEPLIPETDEGYLDDWLDEEEDAVDNDGFDE